MDDVNDVVDELLAVFPATPLAITRDSIEGSYQDIDALVARFSGKAWTELDQKSLEYFGDAVSFYDPAAYQATLPAYLRATLQQTDAIDVMPSSFLRSLARRFHKRPLESRIGELSAPQRKAVARAIAYLAATRDPVMWHDTAEAALEDFWRSQLSGEVES